MADIKGSLFGHLLSTFFPKSYSFIFVFLLISSLNPSSWFLILLLSSYSNMSNVKRKRKFMANGSIVRVSWVASKKKDNYRMQDWGRMCHPYCCWCYKSQLWQKIIGGIETTKKHFDKGCSFFKLVDENVSDDMDLKIVKLHKKKKNWSWEWIGEDKILVEVFHDFGLTYLGICLVLGTV